MFVARSSGVVLIAGKRVPYRRGLTIVRAGDPILLAAPGKFVPLPEPRSAVAPRVESLHTAPPEIA